MFMQQVGVGTHTGSQHDAHCLTHSASLSYTALILAPIQNSFQLQKWLLIFPYTELPMMHLPIEMMYSYYKCASGHSNI